MRGQSVVGFDLFQTQPSLFGHFLHTTESWGHLKLLIIFSFKLFEFDDCLVMDTLLPLKLRFDSFLIFFTFYLFLILILLKIEHALELLQTAGVHALGKADLQRWLFRLESAQLLLELVQLLLMRGYFTWEHRVNARDQKVACGCHRRLRSCLAILVVF